MKTIVEGTVGHLGTTRVLTDAFFHPAEKIVPPDAVYLAVCEGSELLMSVQLK